MAVAVAAGVLSGCAAPSRGSAATGQLKLVASFYPLQWVTARISGQDVASLTKPGAEPHDLELSPRDVGQVADADLVVYVSGFQASVDRAVADQGGGHSLDLRPSARLDLHYTPIEGGQAVSGGGGATDPHFWLDPLRLRSVSDAVATRLASIDPRHATVFRTNAAALDRDLAALDKELSTGLANCANPELVTSHNAFGYLAERYGLHQVGITGLTPDSEPAPGDLAKVAAFVSDHHVRTVYYETLVSPAVAKTIAAETGARTAVLDPIEGLTAHSAGHDYLEIMRSNLAALRVGQPCT
jgi:zinc transport system substrate-binding protein